MSLFLRSFLFEGCGDHRDLHVLTHSFPTLRSSDLDRKMAVDPGDLSFLTVLFHDSPHGSVEAFAEGTLEIREFDHLYRGIRAAHAMVLAIDWPHRSEEHTSELKSLMRNPYAVFCLKTKKNITNNNRIMTSCH